MLIKLVLYSLCLFLLDFSCAMETTVKNKYTDIWGLGFTGAPTCRRPVIQLVPSTWSMNSTGSTCYFQGQLLNARFDTMEYVYPIDAGRKPTTSSHNSQSEIQAFLSGATVLITGATGFLGRLLVEKLLRTCEDLKSIYMLVRPKKDKSAEERFKEYFDNVIFGPLKEKSPKALEKVFILNGDCSLPDLGLSERDKETILSEVGCIFHVAATVRFDEKLRRAAYINVRATRDLIRVAKHAKRLTSFVYVSTAYSFCPQSMIDEKFYNPSLTPNQLLALVDNLDEGTLDKITRMLIGKWPNSYVFSKAICEEVVRTEGANLPLAVVRPSIVVATAEEPIPGWIDNFYGPTGIIAGTGLGLIRSIHCNPSNLADLVPADYVVNAIIAAAWKVSKNNNCTLGSITEANENEKKSNIPIFNYVCSPQKPFTWRECMRKGFEKGSRIPSVFQVWHPYILLNRNKYVHLTHYYLTHILPAYFIDFLAKLVGKQPQLVKAYSKISKFTDIISFFCTQQWMFVNKNTQQLWNCMSAEDKRLFNFDMSSFDWDVYFNTYIPGIRVYVMKDPMESVRQGNVKAFKLKILHYLLVGLFLLLTSKVLLYVCF